MSSATVAAAEQVSYEDLYARWESSNWSATQLDFSIDRQDWREVFSDFERRAALWNYSLFFWGEDAVAANLSPYIDAAPREEQKYFLTTQQVDEARHAVFFARFMREVVGVGDSIGSSLEAIRPELTWGFRRIFERLDTVADELRRDRSKPKLAAAITLYHFIIEASMAQPGQHFIESYLDERGLLPGFREGMRNVSLDEQRHIGFGVKLVSELVAEDPDCRDAIAELLREVVPWTAAVLVPPGWDRRYTECFGATMEQIGADGMRSLETKLRAAGVPIEELPGPPIVPAEMTALESAERGYDLVRAGVIGPKDGPPPRDPETLAIVFDTIRRRVNPDHGLQRAATFQWDFSDAQPWFVRVHDGDSSAQAGRAPAADITLRCRYEDWVDIMAGRQDPRRAMATGRLRPRGNLRLMLRMPKIFA